MYDIKKSWISIEYRLLGYTVPMWEYMNTSGKGYSMVPDTYG